MEKNICIAKIINVHGIKGEVKIKTFTENSDDIFTYKKIYDIEGNIIQIKKKGTAKNCVIARINDVNNRNEAELLKGTELFIARADLPLPQDEEFYHEDLIGMDIKDNISLVTMGTITAIHNFGHGDIIEINFLIKRSNNFFPFTKEIFPEINLDSKFVTFNEKEALFI